MLNLEVSPGRASERCGPRVCVECMNRHLSPRRRSLLASLQGASVWGNEFPRLTPWARGRCPSGATLEFGHFERVTLPRGRCGFMVGSRFRVTGMAIPQGFLVVGLFGYRHPTIVAHRYDLPGFAPSSCFASSLKRVRRRVNRCAGRASQQLGATALYVTGCRHRVQHARLAR